MPPHPIATDSGNGCRARVLDAAASSVIAACRTSPAACADGNAADSTPASHRRRQARFHFFADCIPQKHRQRSSTPRRR